MPKSNDHLMYHESLMSNDFLMSNPFTSNDHLMSTSVIQVRTEQGLVVKIRYSMKTTNLNFFCKSRQNLFSASQKTEFFYKSRKKIRTKFKFLSENWIRTFSRTSSIRSSCNKYNISNFSIITFCLNIILCYFSLMEKTSEQILCEKLFCTRFIFLASEIGSAWICKKKKCFVSWL